MSDLNQVTLIGRLGRDPEAHRFDNGKLKVKLRLAVQDHGDSTTWLDVDVWEKQGELVMKYCAKGKQVCVTGRLKEDRWEKDGVKRSKVYVVASRVQFLGPKVEGTDDGGQQSGGYKSYSSGPQQGKHQQYAGQTYGGSPTPSAPVADDDLPF